MNKKAIFVFLYIRLGMDSFQLGTGPAVKFRMIS